MKTFEQRVHNNGQGDVFGYDEVYRLKNVKFNVPDPTVENPTQFEKEKSISFDKVDNILSIVENLNGQTKTITTDIPAGSNYEKLNQYEHFDQWGLAYDLNGNTIQKGTQHFAYDYRNQLVSAASGTSSTSFKYDVLGRRTQKKVTTGAQVKTTDYLYSGYQVIEERDGTDNILNQYIYGNGIDEILRMDKYSGGTLTPYYFHTDGTGSVTAVTDATGAVVERVNYDLYGMPTFRDASGNIISESSIGNRVLFQGREYDPELNLFNYRARHYDPTMGRFLQTDPMGYTDSMNLYQAFGMNPVNFVDPMGLYKGTPEEYKWVLSQPGIIAPGDFLKQDFNNFLSNFKSTESFLQYCAWWMDKYGRHTPALSLGVNTGEAINGKSVTGDTLTGHERVVRGLWAELEALTWYATMLIGPKPVKYEINPATNQGKAAFAEESSLKTTSQSGTGTNITTYWPKNRGFLYPPERKFLLAGERIDRFGYEGGKFVSPEGVPFEMRGLPPEYLHTKPYHLYEVVKPFEVKYGAADQAFGYLGLGMQYELPFSIEFLLQKGILRRIL